MGRAAKRRERERQAASRQIIDDMKKAVDNGKQIPVSVFADHWLPYEELWLEVWVEGTAAEQAQFATLFARAKCRKADSPEKADIVVFCGGPDVNPSLYGEKAHSKTRFSEPRDKRDIELYNLCFEKGIPMIGVCRGAQFGWVMAGGKLIQHLDGHFGDHPIWAMNQKNYIQHASSVHHQAVKWSAGLGAELLATGRCSTERWISATEKEEGKLMDVEAFFLPDSCFLGVQGHPEYRGYNKYSTWFIEIIRDYIVYNPSVAVTDGFIRVKKDEVAMAKAKREEARASAEKLKNVLNDNTKAGE